MDRECSIALVEIKGDALLVVEISEVERKEDPWAKALGDLA